MLEPCLLQPCSHVAGASDTGTSTNHMNNSTTNDTSSTTNNRIYSPGVRPRPFCKRFVFVASCSFPNVEARDERGDLPPVRPR